MDPVAEDHVVLVDEDRLAQGLAPRATVHTADTPLHLAFSCYLFRPNGDLLLTRRALEKRAWPGTWTNSFCGHPRLEESYEQTIERYADHELGVQVHRIQEVLPDFRYRAVDPSGIVEHEICPVFTAVTSQDLEPNPAEVMEYRWVPVAEVESLLQVASWTVSPWMQLQWPGVLDRLRNPGGRSDQSGRSDQTGRSAQTDSPERSGSSARTAEMGMP
ncbi:isopentenyl-diphosphate Delta-isomerase [Citricoccus sp. NPDC055426]|uniref:isopentenyl-diphosphate Delta-isomerase n=1 Tax=Citricoccus sp. NPDC055426 TaxID=3155536 RepID=UPI00341B6CB4